MADDTKLTHESINEQVARKLGWTSKFYRDPEPGITEWLKDGQSYGDRPSDYAHSIQAAWEIWEHVGNNTEWSIAIEYQGREYDCWLSHPTERQVIVHADTAPLAICLAFLKLP